MPGPVAIGLCACSCIVIWRLCRFQITKYQLRNRAGQPGNESSERRLVKFPYFAESRYNCPQSNHANELPSPALSLLLSGVQLELPTGKFVPKF
jgi:hypothetical protein